tara:strand:- start:2780 stop:3385 length:606 start_codon:yes stop_codon:yes gene_type:complete
MALTKISNQSLSSISSLPAAIPTGALTLLSTQTASSSASISFTSGLDSTYNSYIFKFINMHPATDNANFSFQADTGTNTNYNQTITSSYFAAYQTEDGSTAALQYVTAQDQSQGTGFQTLVDAVGNGNDESCSGTIQFFNPANTSFVKHFIARSHGYNGSDYSTDLFCAGYINTTTAITRVQFKFSSGNMDSGVIKLYGVG